MRRKEQEVFEMYRQICGLRKEGICRKEIGALLDCSVSTVDRAIRLCGEKEIRQDRFEAHREQVLVMYRDGATHKEIADKTGMSVSAINRRLRKLGIRRGRGWHPEGAHRSPREPMGHREQQEPEERLEVRQYAVHVRRVKQIRVKAGRQWKTMQDVSDWYL